MAVGPPVIVRSASSLNLDQRRVHQKAFPCRHPIRASRRVRTRVCTCAVAGLCQFADIARSIVNRFSFKALFIARPLFDFQLFLLSVSFSLFSPFSLFFFLSFFSFLFVSILFPGKLKAKSFLFSIFLHHVFKSKSLQNESTLPTCYSSSMYSYLLHCL